MLKNKKILVTGADGFIGSHLVQALIQKEARVRALTQYNSFNHFGWLESVPEYKEIEIIQGDIRDPHICRTITRDIDGVFHLASLIAIPYSYRAPDSYIQVNVGGTANLCQAALDNSVEHLIHISTSEVYGSAQYVPMDEKHPLQPQSPYSASKIGAESIALSFYYSFGLPVTVLRPFNTYGPRQSTRAVIPSIIHSLIEGKKEIALGSLTPTRDFSYVKDTSESFLRIAFLKDAVGEIINIGTGFEISIKDVAIRLASLFGREVEFLLDPKKLRPPLSEVNRLCCNCAKFKELTSFDFAYSLERGLEETVEWFIKNKKGSPLSFIETASSPFDRHPL